MVFLWILLSVALILGVILGIYYLRYWCFPWQENMKAKISSWSGDPSLLTFWSQYKSHTTDHTYGLDGETNSLSFKAFKTFFELNPACWEFSEKPFGNNYFQLCYTERAEESWRRNTRIRVIFNIWDFQRYRKWLAARKQAEIFADIKKEKERDIQNCQRIIDGVKKDIEKTIEQAQQELQEAQKITEQVKENLENKPKFQVIIEPHVEYDPHTKRIKYLDYKRNIYEIVDR